MLSFLQAEGEKVIVTRTRGEHSRPTQARVVASGICRSSHQLGVETTGAELRNDSSRKCRQGEAPLTLFS